MVTKSSAGEAHKEALGSRGAILVTEWQGAWPEAFQENLYIMNLDIYLRRFMNKVLTV
jgi:hypothetical protein